MTGPPPSELIFLGGPTPPFQSKIPHDPPPFFASPPPVINNEWALRTMKSVLL